MRHSSARPLTYSAGADCGKQLKILFENFLIPFVQSKFDLSFCSQLATYLSSTRISFCSYLFIFFFSPRVANPKNVVYIAPKVLSHLRGTVDEYLRMDIIAKVAKIAEAHAPNSIW
jgi:hypothetical protein